MIFTTESLKNYELIDSGDGQKLERFGEFVLTRPDPEALWPQAKPEEWGKAHAEYIRKGMGGTWKKQKEMPNEWQIEILGSKINLHLGSFKHVGFFPEQMKFVEENLSKISSGARVLNLFGYTGYASLQYALAGHKVTHIDSSQSALDWATKNFNSNGVSTVRVIQDDVRKFVEREIKRGTHYDVILLDPPVYGKGSKKEEWHIESDLLPLLTRLPKFFGNTPQMVALTGYASAYSHVAYANILSSVFQKAHVESGELVIKESTSERLLPAGIFAHAEFI